ncbi:MAG: potassium transporter Kup [Candidatus Hydrogenedentes bacterium]|nr:potassium transporter Kup [Candidatus Hydrogenedentota bacterium]
MSTNGSTSKLQHGLILGALGVVYGDIGTSPLYAVRECFGGTHPLPLEPANVYGVLSLIFWALTLVICIKYVGVVLRADNRGEGGILALMVLALARREGQQRHLQALVVILGLFGAALLYGDGVITPAISVLSAIEGLEVATPLFSPYIVPLTLVVLVILFLFQRFGTAHLGFIFGPIVLVWFASIAILGVVAIYQAPSILAAINPWYGIRFFLHNGTLGFMALGAVFLVVTGGEALYADMGHFGKHPIRHGWFAIVLPALLLNYFGQGAMLLTNPEAVDNPFYHLAPRWALYPLVVLATMATIIASQAVISGAFSLTRQAVMLDYLPRTTITHTSAREIGQIYIPVVNWLLLIATLGLVIGFGSSTNLAAAYGVAVTTTMLFTTFLVSVVARRVWQWPRWLVVLVIGAFLIFDVSFFGAAMMKVTHGGWFPLLVGAGVYLMMTTWRRGRELVRQKLDFAMLPLESFIKSIMEHPGDVARVRGVGIFMAGSLQVTPRPLLHNLKYNKVLHDVVGVLTIVIEDVSHIGKQDKVKVENLGHGFYRVVARYGFMESPDAIEVLELARPLGFDVRIDQAAFFVGRESLKSTAKPGMARWRERIFVFLSRNAANASSFFDIPPRQVVELGVQVEI